MDITRRIAVTTPVARNSVCAVMADLLYIVIVIALALVAVGYARVAPRL
jgi:hypothetical protein